MKYSDELEELIMEMLPMYQAGCRSSKNTLNVSDILRKLMEARRNRKIPCALLDNSFTKQRL